MAKKKKTTNCYIVTKMLSTTLLAKENSTLVANSKAEELKEAGAVGILPIFTNKRKAERYAKKIGGGVMPAREEQDG
jgi:hypothetical protein